MEKNILIDGNEIYNYILSGADRIIKNEKNLNEINVFPVKDKDTGTNLSFTMNHIIANSESEKSVYKTLKSISDAAIEGSYGNSGAIISNYFNGLYLFLQNKERITFSDLINAFNAAVMSAYKSISNPKEGTILTVMKEWGEYLVNENINHISFENLLKESLGYAYKVLDSTKSMLLVLKEADVVDSGAKGFVCFIEGIYSYVKDGKTNHINLSRKENVDLSKINSIHEEITYKYCTEITINNFHSKIKNMEDSIRNFGDSIVVNNINDLVKIHIHTNTPELIAKEMSFWGNIVSNKIDDMKIRQDIIENRKYKIGLMTDSIADLPKDFITSNQIIVIPLNFFCNGSIYLDKYTVDITTVFDLIDKTKEYPASSQPNEKYIENVMKFMTDNYDYVIGIFISDKMSKTFEKIKLISEKYVSEDKKIKIINSKSNSACEGLLVKTAAEFIAKEEGFNLIIDYIEKKKNKLKTFVKIPSLEYAAKSGRVPGIASSIFGKIGFKPVISIDKDGKGIILKKTNIIKLIKKYCRNNRVRRYAVVFTQRNSELEKFVKEVIKTIGFGPEYIESVSAIVGAFMGKGAYGVCILGEDD